MKTKKKKETHQKSKELEELELKAALMQHYKGPKVAKN